MNEIKTQGQLDYEADVAKRPTYHDGRPRKTWEQLCDVARWSWNRVGDVKVAKARGAA